MGVFTLLPAIKVESATMILVGGSLILAVGVLYIALEKTLLVSTALPGMDWKDLGAMKADGISRGILGVQVRYFSRDGFRKAADLGVTRSG